MNMLDKILFKVSEPRAEGKKLVVDIKIRRFAKPFLLIVIFFKMIWKKISRDNIKVWYVGQIKTVVNGIPQNWEMQGVFDNEDKAIQACTTENHFVSSISINQQLPDETCERKESGDIAWYPLLENKPTEGGSEN